MSRITTQSLFATSLHNPSWRSYAVSIVVHAGLVLLAFTVVVPMAIEVHKSFTHVSLIAPLPEYKPKPEILHSVASKPAPVKKFIPPPLIAPAVKPPQVVEAPPEIKPPTPQPELKVELPPAPKAPIKTAAFAPTTELAKAAPPQPKIQVGGFGDPHGAQPSETPHSAPIAPPKIGMFDSPDNTGHSGAAGKAQAGNTIRQTGFGSSGDPGRPKSTAPSEGIRMTAFGDAALAPPPSVNRNSPAAADFTQVEILFKPKPAYTPEARDLRLEGEVSLQVVFQANGTIRVVRVVRGLGHGLDEAAAQAAVRVRFKPATRGGVPVDTNATMKISFELT